MKKIVSILLCLVLLFSAVGVLSSCSRYDGEVKLSRKKVDVDISGYTIVYGDDISNSSKKRIRDFADRIEETTGESLKTMQASSTSASANGGMILVALATAEVADAVGGIDGHGWKIYVKNDTIYITGTTQFFTNMALDYFENHYLPGGGDSDASATVLSVNKKVILEDVPTIDLISGGEYHYEVVYSDLLDDVVGSQHVIPGDHDHGGTSTNHVDMPVDLAATISSTMEATLSATNTLTVRSDATETTHEILVGVTNRDVANNVYKDLSAKQYGLVIRDGKIMVAAWNDEAIGLAATMLTDAIANSLYTDADGNESVVLPADYQKIQEMESSWVTDFPKPTGANIALAGTLSSADNALVYAYRGIGVNATAFDNYCATLVSNGYTLVQSNTIDGNKFATYKNTTANVSLHVEYAAYANDINYSYPRAGQYADTYEPTLRVVSAPLTTSNVLPSDLINANAIKSVTKITDSMVTQFDAATQSSNKGMGWIFTLEDGSFIIVDGATNTTGLNIQDKFWTILNNLYKKAHGTAPTAENPIHIRAWIISHEHSDHYGLLFAFTKAYGSSTGNYVQFDYLLANFTSETQDYNAMQANHVVYNSLSTLKTRCPEMQYIKTFTGQKLYIQNAVLEVLFTHEDMTPKRQPFFNDTSTIIKISIYNTDGNGNVNKDSAGNDVVETFMELGDASLVGSTFLRAMYSNETLDVDQSQVAHHGGYGCESELYDIMSPTAVWWPHSTSFATNVYNPDKREEESLEYRVGHHIIYVLDGCEYAYVADKYATTVLLTKNGAQYDQLWDANYAYGSANASISYDNETVIKLSEKRA